MKVVLENNKMKIYVHEDHMEQGNVYMKHLSAMTREQLHSKADIAGELAGRDIVITNLLSDLRSLVEKVELLPEVSTDINLFKILSESKNHLTVYDLDIYKADSLDYVRQNDFQNKG